MSEKKEFKPLDVGATERVDWRTAQGLSKYVHFDENGDAVIGKNLEVNGTTKLNGGLKPIHTYKLDATTTLYVYFEDVDHDGSVPNDFMGYGWIERRGNGRPCIFYYALQNGKVNRFQGLSSDTIYEYSDNTMHTSKIAKASECQPKLYRHNLRLNNLYRLMYDSTSNLNVDSVDDLRTIMKISSNSDRQILPVCTEDGTSIVPLAVTIHYCKANGTDVTTVSDIVTSL